MVGLPAQHPRSWAMSQRAHHIYERRLGVSAALSGLKSEFLHTTPTAHNYIVVCLCQAQSTLDKSRRQIYSSDLDTTPRAAVKTNHVSKCNLDSMLGGRP